MDSSYYLLRWSDHITNYAEIFLTLREQEEFVDCSIACDDGVVGAHRLVLAGCSPYLRDLLKRANSNHPVIYLVDVSRTTVLLLMEFIYRGQAHIPHNRLHKLVSLGKSMKIKGLCQIVLPEQDLTALPQIPRLHGVPDDDEDTAAINTSRDGSVPDSVASVTREPEENANESSSNSTPSMPSQNRESMSSISQEMQETVASPTVDSVVDTIDANYIPKPKSKKLQTSPLPVLVETPRKSKRARQSIESPGNVVKKNKSEIPGNVLKSPKKTVVPSKVASPKMKDESPRTAGPPKVELKVPGNKRKPMPKKDKKKLEKIKIKKAKLPVYKTKKLPVPFAKPKSDQKPLNLHHAVGIKLHIGQYALQHGIEDTQSHVYDTYGVSMRKKSIDKMILFTKSFSPKKRKCRKELIN